MPQCDVIIPVYNNAGAIQQTLQNLSVQVVPAGWKIHIIVIDDGSTDLTPKIVTQTLRHLPWTSSLLHSTHQGAATARNLGLAHAQGDIIFFLGADIRLRQGALAAHLDFHTNHSDPHLAAVGMIVWDPNLRPSVLMEWMIHGGPQNNYDALLGTKIADPTHFFTAANLSLKRVMLGSHRFNESFKNYGFEDLELGRRLARQGMLLHVLHNARALHHHFYSVAAIARRQYAAGISAVYYHSLYPHEHILPQSRATKIALRRMAIFLGIVPILQGLVVVCTRYNRSFPRIFTLFTSAAFRAGTLK